MQTPTPTPTPIRTTQQRASAKPWYTHRWPWLLMLGPALVIVAGIHTTWLAFVKQDALVVDDYYKQGKAINQDLRRDRVAASLNMALHMAYDAAAGQLVGTISSLGQAQGGKLTLKLVHSTQPDKDMVLELRPDGQGKFSVDLPMLERARWQVLVEGEQRDWRLHGEWLWPQQKTLEIRAGQAA